MYFVLIVVFFLCWLCLFRLSVIRICLINAVFCLSPGVCDHRGTGHCGPEGSQELSIKPTEREVPPTDSTEVHLHTGSCDITCLSVLKTWSTCLHRYNYMKTLFSFLIIISWLTKWLCGCCVVEVFGPDAGQKKVFEGSVRGLVRDVLEGGNSLVFTYGVTNAGKTFTFLGQKHNLQPSIYWLSVSQLSSCKDNMAQLSSSSSSHEYSVVPFVLSDDDDDDAFWAVSQTERDIGRCHSP